MRVVTIILAAFSLAQCVLMVAAASAQGQGYGSKANVQTFSPGIVAGTLDRNSFGAFGGPSHYGLGGYGSRIGVAGYGCGNSYGAAYGAGGYGGGSGAPFYAGPSLDHFAQADDPTRFDIERSQHKLILEQLLKQYDRVYGGFLELERLESESQTNVALSREFRGAIGDFAAAMAFYKSQRGPGVQLDLQTQTNTTGTAKVLPAEPAHNAFDNPGDSPAIGAAAALPILRRKCFECHSAATAKGGLNLESIETLPPQSWSNAERTGILDKVLSGEMPPKNASDPSLLTTEEIGALFAGRALWTQGGDDAASD